MVDPSLTLDSLIYIFRLMTCEEYYKYHEEPPPSATTGRCDNHEIEAITSFQVALLGASTTFFGVLNLFITGWTIKRLGIKRALLIQIFWPAVRLLVQNVGVVLGAAPGIITIQSSQVLTIVGGPAGYLLALNSYVTEICLPEARTGALGRLTGSAMFGTAIGYLAGGLISEAFGIVAPFRVTLILFLLSCLYAAIFLPMIPLNKDAEVRGPKGFSSFFGPLRMFVPQKWVLRDGRTRKEYGVLLLGIGVFAGILATGYIPVLLQMYATDVFHFGTAENSYIVSLNSLIRGLFLTLAFPRIISVGRKWMDKRHKSKYNKGNQEEENQSIPDLPADIASLAGVPSLPENEEEPIEPPKLANEEETFTFDLLFTKYSLIVDGVLTTAATFIGQGWQLYLVAAILPLASGTGSAAKGSILQMIPASQRTDALSAISLVEMVARVSTTSVFGIVFAAFATIEKPHLVFACNGGVALVGFVVLLFCHFPPEGSRRVQDHVHHDSEQSNEPTDE
ncbi:MFS general substrate transporter [Aulographum hederae CBS 113979]|uniref:MFS general substrate transporter n=1 Tax=Aulographum hederae CBS 113979 TaxID=1176131 RepID=A0A6G1H6T6_9PEZI|nr:MFS general substrate transporter [Aulographum hederae CBS 113979]